MSCYFTSFKRILKPCLLHNSTPSLILARFKHGNHSRDVLFDSLKSYTDIKLRPFRVGAYGLGADYSDAYVDVQPYVTDKHGLREPLGVTIDEVESGRVKTPHIPFKYIFQDAFSALHEYCEGKDISNKEFHIPLLTFLSGFLNSKGNNIIKLEDIKQLTDYHADCILHSLQNFNVFKSKRWKSGITAVLTNHLFNPIVVDYKGKSYRISNERGFQYETCPCGICEDEIFYDNIGIGSEYLWYGNPDIIVYPLCGGEICNVVFPNDIEMETYCYDNEEYVEYTLDYQAEEVDFYLLRKDKNVKQIVSQALTFSLFQKVKHKNENSSSSEVSLIPTIAASAENFDIYFYDWNNDILLRNAGKPLPLFNHYFHDGRQFKTFRFSSLLQLWMLINHFTTKPHFKNDHNLSMLQGTCNFLSTFDSKRLEIVEETLRMQSRFEPVCRIDNREYKDASDDQEWKL